MNDYVKPLIARAEDKKDVIGYIFAVNGKIEGGDVYGSSSLFKKVWPTLLRGSAVEALSERKKEKKFEPITAEAVKTFLAEVEKGKTTQRDVTKRTQRVQQESKKGVIFETRDKDNNGVCVRRSYIAY